MKRYLILCSMACFLCIILNTQKMRAETNSNCNSISYRGKPYAPLFIPNENDPIMNVRINLIFIQKDDGTGNFQENNTEHQNLLDLAMITLNSIVSHLVLPEGTGCFTGTNSDMVHDMRIRFVDHRYYVKNSSVWDNNLYYDSINLCPGSSNWYLVGIDDSLNNVIADTLKGINIYFTEDATVYHRCWEVQDLNDTTDLDTCANGACSAFPEYDSQASSRLHMPCLYSKYWWMKNIVPLRAKNDYTPWNPTVRKWFYEGIALSLAHELGHSFNLYHPKDESSYETFYPSSNCKHSIMYESTKDGSRKFLPPQEIGRMYFHAMTTNVQQFIPSTTYLGTKTLNTTVTLPKMRMYYSLSIGSSANVTMPCNMTFSQQGNIVIQNGGVLTVEGASLQSAQESWGGIEVQSGGQLMLSDATINEGNIVVKSGGCLIVKNSLTLTGDHSITIEDGGYLCVSSNASVNLTDLFSLITVYPNAILGCPSCNESCISSSSGLTNTGNGRFVTYTGTDYVQNITISSDYLATGNKIFGGYDVTTTKPVGNVVVENGGELRIKANETKLTKNVKVKLGGKLTISK